MADVMTGVPSIVMGLFIFSIWVLHFGFSGLAGAFALGCLMLPVVIRSSYEMLRLVPDALREASYALGATKSRVTLTVVLPAALGGIVSGALLAVARAAGETAPLLFTILAVTTANPNVFSGANTSLPSQIFANASSPYTGAQARGWGAALTLIAICFILMIAARDRHRPVHPVFPLGISWNSLNRTSSPDPDRAAQAGRAAAHADLGRGRLRHDWRGGLRGAEGLGLLRLVPRRHGRHR